MASENRAPVTLIGLGLMGQALAAAFIDGGHPTTVWNRSADKASGVVGKGARLAGSVADAITASDLVVVCVSDYTAVHAILDPVVEKLAGKVLLNLTSGDSAAARDAAEWAAKNGFGYIDGAIMAIPPVVGTKDAVFLYSGPDEVFAGIESALKVLAPVGTSYLGEDHGLASLYDVALLGIMWGVLNSFLHGVVLLETAGVKATTFAPYANTWIGACTAFVAAYAGQIDEGTYPALDATIDTHLATMVHLHHESKAAGVNAEIPVFVKALTDRAIAAGDGGDSYAAMIKQFRKPSA
ncbi:MULTISPECIES: NAD(P)-dependent oxidoreductase [unclassified Frankia]